MSERERERERERSSLSVRPLHSLAKSHAGVNLSVYIRIYVGVSVSQCYIIARYIGSICIHIYVSVCRDVCVYSCMHSSSGVRVHRMRRICLEGKSVEKHRRGSRVRDYRYRGI